MVQYLRITPAYGMDMPYTTNPHLPRLRLEAARLVVKEGWSTREVARHTGFNQSSIVRWANHLKLNYVGHTIPTKSSRPHSHPKQLSPEIVDTIIAYRLKHRRCAEVLHYLLTKDGHAVSLSSVKRVLRRNGMIRHSKWKKWHRYEERPLPEKPGLLVEIDTIVDGPHTDRLYVYTMIDVCSRWSYAEPLERISAEASWRFVQSALSSLPFSPKLIQSDHGAEFSKHFQKQLLAHEIAHRHTHIRSPTENGHLERFNRTIQEECLSRVPKTLHAYRKAIPEYLDFYNTERPHMGIDMRTPLEVMQSY
jgi:transposase InsO family protein